MSPLPQCSAMLFSVATIHDDPLSGDAIVTAQTRKDGSKFYFRPDARIRCGYQIEYNGNRYIVIDVEPLGTIASMSGYVRVRAQLVSEISR